MWPNPQETADLFTFTEEILNGKLYFLCSVLEHGKILWKLCSLFGTFQWIDFSLVEIYTWNNNLWYRKITNFHDYWQWHTDTVPLSYNPGGSFSETQELRMSKMEVQTNFYFLNFFPSYFGFGIKNN